MAQKAEKKNFITKTSVVIVIIVLLFFMLSIAFYQMVPQKMASHWNINGEVDGYMPRFWGLFFLPLLMFVIAAIFIFIPIIDPMKGNIHSFRGYYDRFVMVFLMLMLALHLQVLLWNIGIEISMSHTIPVIIGILFFFAGVLCEKAEPNWFVGIRTPWTLSSKTVWRKTHRIGGVLFKVCGLLSLLGILFSQHSFIFILVPVFASTVFLFGYSYIEYRKEK